MCSWTRCDFVRVFWQGGPPRGRVPGRVKFRIVRRQKKSVCLCVDASSRAYQPIIETHMIRPRKAFICAPLGVTQDVTRADHRDTYDTTSKSLHMCPSRGNAKRHSRPSRDDGRRVTRLLLPLRPPPLLHSKGSRRRRGCQAAVSEAPSECFAAPRCALRRRPSSSHLHSTRALRLTSSIRAARACGEDEPPW